MMNVLGKAELTFALVRILQSGFYRKMIYINLDCKHLMSVMGGCQVEYALRTPFNRLLTPGRFAASPLFVCLIPQKHYTWPDIYIASNTPGRSRLPIKISFLFLFLQPDIYDCVHLKDRSGPGLFAPKTGQRYWSVLRIRANSYKWVLPDLRCLRPKGKHQFCRYLKILST